MPPHNFLAGTLVLTTAEAAIIADAPTITPFKIVTFDANHTFSSIHIESVLNLSLTPSCWLPFKK